MVPTASQEPAGDPPRIASRARLDGWVVPPDTRPQRTRGRGSGRRTETMTQQLVELVEQFGNFQHKQRGKTDRGVRTYRWVLEQFLRCLKQHTGRLARVGDLTPDTIQAWMDAMASRRPGARDDARPPVGAVELLRLAGEAARPGEQSGGPVGSAAPPAGGAKASAGLCHHGRARTGGQRAGGAPRDVALFLILRYTGMRRESVATLQVRHLDGAWGLRGVRVKAATAISRCPPR